MNLLTLCWITQYRFSAVFRSPLHPRPQLANGLQTSR